MQQLIKRTLYGLINIVKLFNFVFPKCSPLNASSSVVRDVKNRGTKYFLRTKVSQAKCSELVLFGCTRLQFITFICIVRLAVGNLNCSLPESLFPCANP